MTVYKADDNRNAAHTVVEGMARWYSDKYDIHIQEFATGRPEIIDEASRFLKASAFGITGITPVYNAARYESHEDVIRDELSFDRNALESAFGVINLDDELLANHSFNHRVITYARYNEAADYVARNVSGDNKSIEFDIDDHNRVVHVKVNIPGEHNVYSTMMAYAFAREFGFSDDEIVTALSEYKAPAFKQHVNTIAGRLTYLDGYNVSRESVLSGLETLSNARLDEGAKRIAVIGGRGRLGEQVFNENFNIGKLLSQFSNIDEFIIVGPKSSASLRELQLYGNGRSLFEGAKSVIFDKPILYTSSLSVAGNRLREDTTPGDAVLIKCGARLNPSIIVDQAFGSSYTVYNSNLRGKKSKTREAVINYYANTGKSNLLRYRKGLRRIVIPATVNKKPVSRIGKRVLSGREELQSVIFTKNVRNIGEKAFSGCTGIRYLELPSTIQMIEDRAFEKCTGLETIVCRGILHIGEEAFKGCTSLRNVKLDENCEYISETAFDGCENFTIIAPLDSNAHKFALDNGIPYIECERTIKNEEE